MTANNNDLVREWYKFSMTDLATAKHLNDTMRPKPLEIICYHCQQAAEKMLKGFLVSNGIIPPKTHDLHQLRNDCTEINNAFDELYDICAFLTQYSSQPRYPNEIEISEIDVERALKAAQEMIEFFEGQGIELKPPNTTT